MKRPERFNWAAQILDLAPDDHILEIGCGVGFAVEAIVPLLVRGMITAIDRSPSAIAKAIDRNREAIQDRKAEFLITDLLAFPNPATKYNKILCFNVNFFWTKKSITEECTMLKSLLSKSGLLYIFYGPMIGKGFEETVQLVGLNLKKKNFKVRRSLYDEQLKCCCIIAAV